jgi:hypothetical protein
MVVDDLDVVRLSVTPYEANPTLVVDSNRMLTGTITLQRLEAVSRPKIRQRRRSM